MRRVSWAGSPGGGTCHPSRTASARYSSTSFFEVSVPLPALPADLPQTTRQYLKSTTLTNPFSPAFRASWNIAISLVRPFSLMAANDGSMGAITWIESSRPKPLADATVIVPSIMRNGSVS